MRRVTHAGAVLSSFLFLVSNHFIIVTANAEPTLTRTYGGPEADQGRAIRRTADGGLILAGYTQSFSAGATDFYLVKTDAVGNTVWEETYGGAAHDACYDVAQTSDGGYILAGYTGVGPSSFDAYVVRVDAQGNFLWDKSFGASGRDEFNAVRQTTDGGFILCGDKTGESGGSLYLVRVDAAGNTVWEKTYGGGNDHGEAVDLTRDGGYVAGGWRGDGSIFPEYDAWVVKTDSDGNVDWQQTLDSSIDDRTYTVLQTSDGGYAAAGHIGAALALWRFDASGGLDWQQMYGGPSSDYANDMVETADGGFILGGNTIRDSQWEQYFVKTNQTGAAVREEVIGDTRWEFCWGVDVTSDGDYALFGSTNSTPGDDYDWFLAIVEGEGAPSGVGDSPPPVTGRGLRVSPNPVRFETRFSFEMSTPGRARLAVYDVRGARVATVMDRLVDAGDQSVVWRSRSAGQTLRSGVYFARLEASGRVATRKFVIAR